MTTNRRELLKRTAVAAGAVGVAWTAPRVEGLTLRPDYAAAQSGQLCTAYTTQMAIQPITHPINASQLTLTRDSSGADGVSSVNVLARADGGNLGGCSLNIESISTDQLDAVAFDIRGTFSNADLAGVNVGLSQNFGFGVVIVSGNLCCD